MVVVLWWGEDEARPGSTLWVKIRFRSFGARRGGFWRSLRQQLALHLRLLDELLGRWPRGHVLEAGFLKKKR